MFTIFNAGPVLLLQYIYLFEYYKQKAHQQHQFFKQNKMFTQNTLHDLIWVRDQHDYMATQNLSASNNTTIYNMLI